MLHRDNCSTPLQQLVPRGFLVDLDDEALGGRGELLPPQAVTEAVLGVGEHALEGPLQALLVVHLGPGPAEVSVPPHPG